jgi:valyl-tRNA synthetase
VASAVLAQAQVVLPLAGLIDLDAERDKLTKQLHEAEAEVNRVSQKLANGQFRAKAPADVIGREEERLAAAQSRVDGLRARLEELG